MQLAASVLTLGCLSLVDVQAADSGSLETVIVSAQKQTERLQDVPVPVTALDAEELATSNQLRLQDYYNKVPGLTWATKDTGEPIIAIRGLMTGGYTNPTVGVVIDDVSYGASVVQGSSPSVPDIDPSDLERIEILRGPQGTLYGASSLGGLLKFVTVDPSVERLSGHIQASSSSVEDSDDFGYGARGSINVPLGNSVAIRASGFKTRDAGYVDNVQTGEDDINRRESSGGRVALLWQASEAFTLKLNALLQDTETFGPNEVDAALGSDLRQSILRGTGGHRRETRAFSAAMSGKAGNVDWISVTGYSEDTADTIIDGTAIGGGFYSSLASGLFGASGVGIVSNVETEKFSQEVRVTIPLSSRVQWMVGGFYTKEELAANAIYTARSPDTGATAGRMITFATPTDFKEYAAFTNVTVQVTGRFDVQFGGRRFENEESFAAVRTGPLASMFFGSDPSLAPAVSAKDESFTYLVTPRFKISPDLMVYTRLASGYRPGGANASCLPTFPCRYKADSTDNYELGIKGSVLEQRLSFDASLYYIDWKDLQLTLFSPTFFSYIDNASRARSRGAELSVESRPLEDMTLSAWMAWSDAELTEDLPRGQAVGNAGDRLPYSSRISGGVSLDQEFMLGELTAFVGGTVSYVGDRKGAFQSLFASIPGRQTFPSYTQVDLRTGVNLDSWTVSAFINNLTDKRGVLKGGLDATVPTYYTYIQPRTAGVSLTKSF